MQCEGAAEKRCDARQALLESAKSLFLTKGYAAVSTRELAERAEVNLGAIQYHFGSKLKLFLAAVYELMEENGCAQQHLPLFGAATTQLEAGRCLFGFVHEFLSYLINPEGAQACRLTLREILGSSPTEREIREALTEAFVRDFIAPVDARLVNLIGWLAPTTSEVARELATQSIIGQCSFYLTHGPFLEKLRTTFDRSEETLAEISRHITEFSLRGLGCGENLIREVLETPLRECGCTVADENRFATVTMD